MADQRQDDDKRSASRRVAHTLKTAIDAGQYPVGTPLPPIREIAAQHDVAVNTALAAIRQLAAEGYVDSKPNAGSYVRDRTIKIDSAQELRRVRTELDELRSQVRDNAAAIDDRLSELSSAIARLEHQDRPAGPARG